MGQHLKHGTVWDTDGQVGKYRKRLVRHDTLERQVVRNFVNSKEQIMVESAANSIRAEYERQREGFRIPEQNGYQNLSSDNTEYNPLGQWFVPHQFDDLIRVR